MKPVEMTEATRTLADYVRHARKEPIVVVDQGRTVAALVPLDGEDWEDFVVTRHPGLLAGARESMRRYRAEGGATLEEVMKECGVAPKPKERLARRPPQPAARRNHRR